MGSGSDAGAPYWTYVQGPRITKAVPVSLALFIFFASLVSLMCHAQLECQVYAVGTQLTPKSECQY